MQTNRSTEPPDPAAPHLASRASADVVGRRARAELGGRGSVVAAADEPDLSRAAGAATSVLPDAAPEVVRRGSSETSPLFTRHTLGVIEAERDIRRQRRARGAAAYRGAAPERAAGEPHGRIVAAVAGNARIVAQARLDMDRWVDEGGMVPFEAAAVLRATTEQEITRCSS
jgi:hypothetical protein